jgi:hypothetical protein
LAGSGLGKKGVATSFVMFSEHWKTGNLI